MGHVSSGRALQYGGAPHDIILRKLEETDPKYLDPNRPLAEDSYDDYARTEMVDWSPDAPYHESDHPRRDGSLSRSIINLRYNGTRGSRPELPRHPELFYGFTDRDPRGTSTDPRLNEARRHVETRTPGKVVRMGNNDDHHLAERPWTGQDISYGAKEVHRRLKNNTRVFLNEKIGKALGRNLIVDPYTWGQRQGRRRVLAIADSTPVFADLEAFTVSGAGGGGIRGVDGGVAGAELAPWHNSVGDAAMAVQQYGQVRGGETPALPAGGGRIPESRQDQEWASSLQAASARTSLATTMATATAAQRLRHEGMHGHFAGVSREGALVGGGLAPAPNPEDALRKTVSAPTVDAFSNVDAIVRGLREGTASGRRRIAGEVVLDPLQMHASTEQGARRPNVSTADPIAQQRLVEASVLRAAAAQDLTVQAYGGLKPAAEHELVAGARATFDPSAMGPQHMAAAVGKSAQPMWRSATQAHTVTGSDRTFAANRVGIAAGAAPVGPKSLRPGQWSTSTELGGVFEQQ